MKTGSITYLERDLRRLGDGSLTNLPGFTLSDSQCRRRGPKMFDFLAEELYITMAVTKYVFKA